MKAMWDKVLNMMIGLLMVLTTSPVLYASSPSYGLPLEGGEAEVFLRTATVLHMKPIGVGITKPRKVTMTDGTRTIHAIWKTVDDFRNETKRGVNGGWALSFRDSYRYEVAAYELDKLLGLGLVPPTVERSIGDKTGSLQLWVENAFTELDRRERGLKAPDAGAWSDRIYDLRLLEQLIYNEDTQNIRNVLYDPGYRVYAIDHSRSFRVFGHLGDEVTLRRFSRCLLAKLRNLERRHIDQALGKWLDGREIDALLIRRDLILERAEKLAGSYGEAAVYYE
jgi:hypothetical protein